MSFVSYAQNFEDVMLWRALQHVQDGFYIDVGAWSPTVDSVTRAFYDRGWRGINVEPNPVFHEQLQRERPRDVNLCVAVSDAPGTMTMNIVGDTGLSTLDDDIAATHRKAGWELEQRPVEVLTLAEIWRQHGRAEQDVHFLKVDVEGLEHAVLRGNDWHLLRPWVVVVESTMPVTQIPSYAPWEPTLLEADYALAYRDGLNRFYIARERADLLPAFEFPPNVFDDFRRAAEHALAADTSSTQGAANAHEDRLTPDALLQFERREQDWQHRLGAALESRTQEVDSLLQALSTLRASFDSQTERLTALETKLDAARASAADRGGLMTHGDSSERAIALQSEVEALRASWSWKLTAPLRLGLDLARAVGGGSVQRIRVWARNSVLRALSNPALVRLVHRALQPFPSLHERVTRGVTNVVREPHASPSVAARLVPGRRHEADTPSMMRLTPTARRILRQLDAPDRDSRRELA